MISLLDVALVILIYVIVISIISISEFIRKRFNLKSTSTRHVIHLLAGDNMLLLPFFSAMIYPLTIPVGLALLTAYSFHRSRKDIMSRTMIDDEYDKFHAYGPLYYIISIGILVVTMWNMRHIAMAAVMIMAWGDGTASLVGKRFKNRHVYPGSSKSLEGSTVMMIFSTLGALLAMVISYQAGLITLSPISMIIISVTGALVGTIVEACTIGSLKAFDNFTVPLSAVAAMYLVSLII